MNDNNQRDKELDDLLAPLRKANPKSSDLAAWQAAVSSASTTTPWWKFQARMLPQLAAALALGLLLGIFVAPHASHENSEKNLEASATIETIYAKAD
jgi:hypothetical protein